MKNHPPTSNAAAENGRDLAKNLKHIGRGEAAFPVLHREPVRLVPLDANTLTIGSGTDADLVLHDATVGSQHARIESDQGQYFLRDLHSESGTFVNGRAITRESLTIGNLIHIGSYLFLFKGTHLVWIKQSSAPTLACLNLCQKANDIVLLDDVTLFFQPGEFIGLLGPSGAGKTTLLNALHGFHPAQSGKVFLDGEPLYEKYDRLSHQLGFVPQTDLVHPELNARQALDFVSKLRLPKLSAMERFRLVEETLSVVDLQERADLTIALLSGGQRKRVAVGVELLCKPGVLFLDEPTSGLDPGTEAKLMVKLKQLANLGKTVICTTHTMGNVDLFDKIAVLVPGGKLAFFGTPAEARTFFDVEHPIDLYDRLEDKTPADWQQLYRRTDAAQAVKAQAAKVRLPKPLKEQMPTKPPEPATVLGQWAVLSHRFAQVLFSDAQNFAIALVQAVVMSHLICLVMGDMPAISFLLVISSLWFGCSSSAQQLVRERSIYRRERMVNLRLDSYLFSKFWLLAIIGAVQCTLMLAMVRMWKDEIDWPIMLPVMVLASWNGIAMGLIISALASTADKATAIVPMILLPQIILAGVLTPLGNMSPAMSIGSKVVVARWANQAMEVSLMEGKTINADFLHDEANLRPLWNLYPEFNLWKDDGRRDFLRKYNDTVVRRQSWLTGAFTALVGFLIAQMIAAAVVLRKQDVF
ncbi:MAG: ATP-binding cassette domain-containing protein [Gemmataceae bacterium]|nr:ATP-binding cassette domain-containing protein [Gemmataceae bacterium]